MDVRRKSYGRSDSNGDITVGVADRWIAVDLGELGVHQVVEMLLVARHGRREVGLVRLRDLDRGVILQRCLHGLQRLREFVRCQEYGMLHPVDIA